MTGGSASDLERRPRRHRRQAVAILATTVLVLTVVLVVLQRDASSTRQARVTATEPSDTSAPTTSSGPTTTTIVSTTTTTTSSADPTTTTAVPEAGILAVEYEQWVVRGRAVDADGQPIDGVYLYDAANWVGGWPIGRTGNDGTYEVPCPAGPLLLFGVGPGIWAMASPDQNWQPAFAGGGATLGEATKPMCAPQSEQSEIITVMHPGGMITGVAYRADGQPLTDTPGSAVVYTDLAGMWADAGELIGRIDSDGRYWLAGLPAGDYWLSNGMGTGSSQTVHVEPGQTVTADWGPDGPIAPTNSSSA
jgi:hypothetical protein